MSELGDSPTWPCKTYLYGDEQNWQGMTLRQYAAIQAMQGILAMNTTVHLTYGNVAHDSVRYADALIAELSKEKSE